MKNTVNQIEQLKIADLIPYARNSRTHSDEQVAEIAASIREFGWTNPVLIDQKGTIVAGHGRVLAARKLGIETVPCIRLGELSPAQIRAYVIADNKIALNAGWDEDMLAAELAALKEEDFDLGMTGFTDDEISEIIEELEDEPENPYSTKINGLIYEVRGEKPKIDELFDTSKCKQLIGKIESSELPQEISKFLIAAASRHVVFDYGKIAEFYAHASKDVQELMEQSALVVVDMDSAIENGYVQMTKVIDEIQSRAMHE